MGNNLFGVNISGIINDVISPAVLDATLIQITPGTRTPGDITDGTNPTTANFAAKGFIDTYDDDQIDGTNVQVGDRKIILIGDSIESLTVPGTGDQITIEGETWRVVNVMRDPDAATYECQARQ